MTEGFQKQTQQPSVQDGSPALIRRLEQKIVEVEDDVPSSHMILCSAFYALAKFMLISHPASLLPIFFYIAENFRWNHPMCFVCWFQFSSQFFTRLSLKKSRLRLLKMLIVSYRENQSFQGRMHNRLGICLKFSQVLLFIYFYFFGNTFTSFGGIHTKEIYR